MTDKLNNTKEKYGDDIGSIEAISARSSSNFSVFVNIVCAMAGTGVLGLPLALKNSGWVGLILIALCALMSIYTSKLLIECLYVYPEKRLEEFPDIGEAAFGKFGKIFVRIFHYSATLSLACIYVLISGLNVHRLIVSYNNTDVLSTQLWILISGLVIWIPFVLLKTLKEVAILSIVGALCTILVIMAVIIQGGINFNDIDSASRVTTVLNVQGFPVAFATIAFSFTGNVVFPHVEATMKSPQSWNRVMIISISFVTAMYLIMAVCGYVYYGQSVLSPILDSLPVSVGSTIGYVLITFHVILAAPIYLCSFSLEQENLLKINSINMSPTKEFICRFFLRTGILGCLTIIAIFLPYFSDLMSLFGAVSGALVVFLIPVVCHYKLFGWRHRSVLHHIWALLVILVGTLGLILGTVGAIQNLITSVQNDDSSSTNLA